jgi:hypothetical protein
MIASSIVAADAQRLRTTIPPSEITATSVAADVDDHVPGRLGDRKPSADRCHRLDQVRRRAPAAIVASSTARFDARDAGWDADHDARCAKGSGAPSG